MLVEIIYNYFLIKIHQLGILVIDSSKLCFLLAILTEIFQLQGVDLIADSSRLNDMAHFYFICALYGLIDSGQILLHCSVSELKTLISKHQLGGNWMLLIQCLIPGNWLRYSQQLLVISDKFKWNMGFSVQGQRSWTSQIHNPTNLPVNT